MPPQDNSQYPYQQQQPGQQYDPTGQYYAAQPQGYYGQVDYGYDNNGGPKLRKILIIAGVALGILLLVSLLAVTQGGGKKASNNQSNTIKLTEANAYETSAYKAARPNGWADISDNLTAKQLPILDIEQYNDVKISASGFNEDKQQVNSILYTGWSDVDIADDAIKTMAAQEASKKQLESSVNTTFAGKPEDICETVNGGDSVFTYNGAKFTLEVTKSSECVLSTADQQTYGTKSYHYLYYFGIKNSKAYFMQLRTTDADWTTNQAFYNETLWGTLEPK